MRFSIVIGRKETVWANFVAFAVLLVLACAASAVPPPAAAAAASAAVVPTPVESALAEGSGWGGNSTSQASAVDASAEHQVSRIGRVSPSSGGEGGDQYQKQNDYCFYKNGEKGYKGNMRGKDDCFGISHQCSWVDYSYGGGYCAAEVLTEVDWASYFFTCVSENRCYRDGTDTVDNTDNYWDAYWEQFKYDQPDGNRVFAPTDGNVLQAAVSIFCENPAMSDKLFKTHISD